MLSNVSHHQPRWEDVISPILQVCVFQSLRLFYKSLQSTAGQLAVLTCTVPVQLRAPSGQARKHLIHPATLFPTLNSCQSILNRVGTNDQSAIMQLL